MSTESETPRLSGSPPASVESLIGVDADHLERALRADPEFQLASRYWTCRIRLTVDECYLTIVVVDGDVVEVQDTMTGFDPYDIVLSGSAQVWRNILAPVPVPFYQDFWSARFMHGFRTDGDLDTLCAYYLAVRRIADLMRDIANQTTHAATATTPT